MKLEQGFDKQSLKITYEVPDKQDPVSITLSDVNRDMTEEDLTQALEAIMSLIAGDFRRIYVTRVTVGADVQA